METASTNPNNTQTVGQNIKAEGDVTFENVTQIGQQTIVQSEVFFEEISVDGFSADYFPSPTFIGEILTLLNSQKLILLEGDLRIRKSDLARHISCFIKKQNLAEVKESIISKNSGLNLLRYLRKEDQSTIFILPDVTYQNFGARLTELSKLARRNNHYVIATTDESKETWTLDNNEYFYPLSYEKVKHQKHLCDNLSDEASLAQWYEKLNARQQLLALSLSLFDESYTDQFFASLEILFEQSWKKRDATLKSLDYCDLIELQNFFSFTNKNTPNEKLKVTSAQKRRLLLKVAWVNHRRQILSALPTLISLVLNSTNNTNVELYGTSDRIFLLRAIISEALSNIALVSQDTKVVEEKILLLASNSDIDIQAVAANTLALFRDNKNRDFYTQNESYINSTPDEKLFKIIESWQKQSQAISIVESFLKKLDYDASRKPVDYIRSTLALTVGFASESDASNNISPKLLSLFRALLFDTNKLVRNRVLRDTLPRVAKQHLLQIKDDLVELLKKPKQEFIFAISNSLFETYKFRSEDVDSTLAEWQNLIKSLSVSRSNRLSLREALFGCILLTYGKIQSSENFLRILNFISDTLANETHKYIRSTSLDIIDKLIISNNTSVATSIVTTIIVKTTADEQEIIVESLAKVYLKERKNLGEGEAYISVNETQYPVWLKSERNKTSIELILEEWIKTDNFPLLQKIATQASTKFAEVFDLEERRKIENLKRIKSDKTKESSVISIYGKPYFKQYPPNRWYLGRFIPWLSTLDKKSYQISIRNLLPESLKLSGTKSTDFNFVVKKWETSTDTELSTTTRYLQRSLFLARNFKIIFIASVIVLTWLFFSIKNSFRTSNVTQPSSISQETTPPSNSQTFPTSTTNSQSTPPVEFQTTDNPFSTEDFPQVTCGDDLPSNPDDYPVNFYPVFVEYTSGNLEVLKSSYCQDSLQVTRRDTGEKSIQVASFKTRERAELFSEFLLSKADGNVKIEVGQTTTIPSPP